METTNFQDSLKHARNTHVPQGVPTTNPHNACKQQYLCLQAMTDTYFCHSLCFIKLFRQQKNICGQLDESFFLVVRVACNIVLN